MLTCFCGGITPKSFLPKVLEFLSPASVTVGTILRYVFSSLAILFDFSVINVFCSSVNIIFSFAFKFLYNLEGTATLASWAIVCLVNGFVISFVFIPAKANLAIGLSAILVPGGNVLDTPLISNSTSLTLDNWTW